MTQKQTFQLAKRQLTKMDLDKFAELTMDPKKAKECANVLFEGEEEPGINLVKKRIIGIDELTLEEMRDHLEDDYIFLEVNSSSEKEKISENEKTLKKLERQLAEKEEILEKAMQERDSVKKELESFKRESKIVSNAYEKNLAKITELGNMIEDTYKILLVHPSASVNQLLKFKFYKKICTKTDYDVLSKIGIIDEIIDIDDVIGPISQYTEIGIANFMRRITKSNKVSFKSEIDFIKAFSYLLSVEDNVEAIYSNSGIDYFVKSLGGSDWGELTKIIVKSLNYKF